MLALSFPSDLRSIQQRLLLRLGVDSSDAKTLSVAIKRLSDYYVNNPEKSTPWHEPWAQIAYLIYYMPLNWWRAMGVFERGQQINFFAGFSRYIDFGSGLGSVSHAFDALGMAFQSGDCVENGRDAVEIHRDLAIKTLTPLSWRDGNSLPPISPNTLAIFSYSYTELSALPSWVDDCEGLLIIEPSTKDDARRLQKTRQDFLDRGWYIWGPCTHSMACPMLVSGDKDWCHDRFSWKQPDWLKAVEDHLPIKNSTLPCAWMMFKKTPPSVELSNMGRITGDLLDYKGYAKQLVCRSDIREFLSWQKKFFKRYPLMGRGELVHLAPDITKKGDELRLTKPEDVRLYKRSLGVLC